MTDTTNPPNNSPPTTHPDPQPQPATGQAVPLKPTDEQIRQHENRFRQILRDAPGQAGEVDQRAVDYAQLRKDIYADIWDNIRTVDHVGSVNDRCNKLADRIMLYVKGQIALATPKQEAVTLSDEDRRDAVGIMHDAFIAEYQRQHWKNPDEAPYKAVSHTLDALLERFEIRRRGLAHKEGECK